MEKRKFECLYSSGFFGILLYFNDYDIVFRQQLVIVL